MRLAVWSGASLLLLFLAGIAATVVSPLSIIYPTGSPYGISLGVMTRFVNGTVAVSGPSRMNGPETGVGFVYFYRLNETGSVTAVPVVSNLTILPGGFSLGNTLEFDGTTAVAFGISNVATENDTVIPTALVYYNNGTAWISAFVQRNVSITGNGDLSFGFAGTVYGDNLLVSLPTSNALLFYKRITPGVYSTPTLVNATLLGVPQGVGTTMLSDASQILVGSSACVYSSFTYVNQVLVLDWSGNVLQRISVPASASSTSSCFGGRFAWDGNILVIGASFRTSSMTYGQAFVYQRNTTTNLWDFYKPLVPSPSGLAFGMALAVQGDFIAVGSSFTLAGTEVAGAGAVWLFARNQGGSNNWGQVVLLNAPAGSGRSFGNSIAMQGYLLTVGFPSANQNLGEGAVYVYQVGCAPGSYRVAANNTCEMCPPSLSSAYASSVCSCAAGQYMNASSSSCMTCLNGTISNPPLGVSATGCSLCPNGTYTNNTGASSCDTCPRGFLCNLGFLRGPIPGFFNTSTNGTNIIPVIDVFEIPWFVYLIFGLLAVAVLVLIGAVCAMRRWQSVMPAALTQPLLAEEGKSTVLNVVSSAVPVPATEQAWAGDTETDKRMSTSMPAVVPPTDEIKTEPAPTMFTMKAAAAPVQAVPTDVVREGGHVYSAAGAALNHAEVLKPAVKTMRRHERNTIAMVNPVNMGRMSALPPLRQLKTRDLPAIPTSPTSAAAAAALPSAEVLIAAAAASSVAPSTEQPSVQ